LIEGGKREVNEKEKRGKNLKKEKEEKNKGRRMIWMGGRGERKEE
jgi:hypothetical protein